MLKFFKHSYMAQLVVIVLLIAVLWAPVFIGQPFDVVEESPITPLYNILTGMLGSSNIAITILVMVLFAACVLFFNAMMSVDNMVTHNSSIAAFVMVLCMCCAPIHNEYYPFLVSLPFIMIAQQTIFLIYGLDKPELYLFRAGFFVALGSMFYFPAILLIFWVLLALAVHGVREFRLYLIPVVGLLVPYIILASISYIVGVPTNYIDYYTHAVTSFSLKKISLTTMEITVLATVFALSVLSIIKIWSQNADNTMDVRKRKIVALLLFMLSIFMLFTQQPVMCNGMFFLMASVLISMALCCVKRTKLVDIVIIVIMVAVIANQYLPLFGVIL